MANIDLTKNEKQAKFFNDVMEAVAGTLVARIFMYGGAARGGKTFVILAILALFCKMFPKTRWHVIRKSMPALQDTTIPSFEQLIDGSKNWVWNRDKSNYFAHYKPTGSKIFFKPENILQDPELRAFNGLETNGIFLEQIEELSPKMYEKAMERKGSFTRKPPLKMPPGFLFMSFNPNQTWVKEKLYIPAVKKLLGPLFYFMAALPKDNPFVTQDQWDSWGLMDERHYKTFIEGDWTDFSADDNRWAFSYDQKKHSGTPELNRQHPVYLSFDFNKNPICCSVIQHYGGRIRILETIKLANSDIYRLCDVIKAKYLRCVFIVTGDASGTARSAMVQDNLNYYKIIKAKLGLGNGAFKVPTVNPRLENNQVLINAILSNYPVEIHGEDAKALHYDLANVKMNPDGTIVKADRSDPAQQADALDTFRYWCNVFMKWFVKL